jgi:curved DNA-binding protein CbpA
MRVPDHYAALGVQPTADESEFGAAYKNRALQTHPDKGSDGEDFKRVGAAYAVLSDADKRRAYDDVRADGFREGERDQTDYQSTGFNSSFDAPFFGQRWDAGETFTVYDAIQQFDRFLDGAARRARADARRAQGHADLEYEAARPRERETRSDATDEYGRAFYPGEFAMNRRHENPSGYGDLGPAVDRSAGKPPEERRPEEGPTPLQMAAARRRTRRPRGRGDIGPPIGPPASDAERVGAAVAMLSSAR